MAYKLEEAQNEILRICDQLTEKGLIARTWGNVSLRLEGGEFLITPSGRDYTTMRPDELVRVRIKDAKWEGDIKPSSEKGMHSMLYKSRPEVNVIVHTHQSNASAVSLLGEDLDIVKLSHTRAFTAGTDKDGSPQCVAGADEAALLGPLVPCAKYGLSSTKTLAKNVLKASKRVSGCPAVLMKSHGAIFMGEYADKVMEVCDALETVSGRLYEKKCGETISRESGESQMSGEGGNFCLHARTPFILEMSRRGRNLEAYLDDLAQIGGTSINCVESGSGGKAFDRALKGRSAVLIKNDGALCFGRDESDAEAVAIVLEKNCLAANLALKKALKPLSAAGAKIDRAVYTQKYAALKDEK